MSILNAEFKLLAYSDSASESNPIRKHVDWKRTLVKLTVSNPHSNEYKLAPEETRTIFSGSRATSTDGTTAFDVSLSALDPSRYRFTYSAGTDPVLRTDRDLTLTGIAVTIVVNVNASISMTLPGGSGFTFSGVVAGDTIYLPDTRTGDDASVFNTLNCGFWKVLAVVTSRNLVLARPTGDVFEATAETVTLTSNAQVQAFSAAGVQVGDSVELSSGFASVTQKSYDVLDVTSTWFEVSSSTPLPAETGILPTASGISFFRYTKKLLYIESDQEVVVRVNGDSGSSQRLSPFEAGNADRVGVYMKTGPTWSLDILNRSTNEANILIVMSE